MKSKKIPADAKASLQQGLRSPFGWALHRDPKGKDLFPMPGEELWSPHLYGSDHSDGSR